MQYSEVYGYKISRLTLGTVALGLNYGISNDNKKPARKDSFEILSYALKGGINTVDTARSYGDAEQLIGDFLDCQERKQPINIITKFKLNPENLFNEEKLRTEVYNSLHSSLAFLKLNRVPFLLFHMDRNLPMERVLEILPTVLIDLKSDGLIDVGGVSVDHPDEVESFLKYSIIEAIQVPINIFDMRLIKNGMLKYMNAEKKIVFARSIFLQGLFFMSSINLLKGKLSNAAKHIHALQDLAKSANMSIAQLAFSYIRDMEEISSIVFGAVNAEQVKQNINLLQGNPITTEIRDSIQTLFANIPEDIITPGLWSL